MVSAQPAAKECERTTGIQNEKYLNKEQCLDKKVMEPMMWVSSKATTGTITLRIDQNSQYRFPLDSSEAIGVRN